MLHYLSIKIKCFLWRLIMKLQDYNTDVTPAIKRETSLRYALSANQIRCKEGALVIKFFRTHHASRPCEAGKEEDFKLIMTGKQSDRSMLPSLFPRNGPVFFKNGAPTKSACRPTCTAQPPFVPPELRFP